jgi:hypothetical protein
MRNSHLRASIYYDFFKENIKACGFPVLDTLDAVVRV